MGGVELGAVGADIPAILTDDNSLIRILWCHGRAKQIEADRMGWVVAVVGRGCWWCKELVIRRQSFVVGRGSFPID